jgi:hypothetical protein
VKLASFFASVQAQFAKQIAAMQEELNAVRECVKRVFVDPRGAAQWAGDVAGRLHRQSSSGSTAQAAELEQERNCARRFAETNAAPVQEGAE